MKIRIDVRKIPLLTVAALIFLLGYSYGIGTAPVTTQRVQSMNGIVLIVTGAFIMTQTNFFPTIETTPATSSCTWSSGACQTDLTQGNWYFAVILALNTVPSAATTFTITVHMTSMPGGQSAISFTVPSTATQGSSLVFLFDAGTTSLVTPLQITILVQ